MRRAGCSMFFRSWTPTAVIPWTTTASSIPPTNLLTVAPFSSIPYSLNNHGRFLPVIGDPSSRPLTLAVLFSTAAVCSVSHTVYAKEHLNPDSLPKEVVLYQYEACPFCNKVKAFLDYYSIPYKVVEVNPISKKEIKWSEYKKVPILTVDGEELVNSSDIIDKLGQKLFPPNVVGQDEETQWRRWVDDHLVHVLSPNIYRTTSEALESFDYITNHGNFSFSEKIAARYFGAAIMYFVSKRLKKKYNITDERAALYECAETWVGALDGREFHGGSKPNLADLAVFGVLRPIRYLRSGKDMVEHTHIGEWYGRMECVVGESSRLRQ